MKQCSILQYSTFEASEPVSTDHMGDKERPLGETAPKGPCKELKHLWTWGSALFSQCWINAPSTDILGCQYGQGPCGKVEQAAIKAIQNSLQPHTHSWDWVSTTLISHSWILCVRLAQQLQLTGSNKDFHGRKVIWSEASLFTCPMPMRYPCQECRGMHKTHLITFPFHQWYGIDLFSGRREMSLKNGWGKSSIFIREWIWNLKQLEGC